MASSRFKVLDLFCGCGGLTLGLQQAGFDIALALDKWDRALESYRLNFSHPAHCRDLATLEPSEIEGLLGLKVDVIVGGPPCQGFSVQRIGGDFDPRNNLVLKFGELITGLRPSMFLMENVPGLLGKRGRNLFDQFCVEMRSGGYDLNFKIINAADFGVPQVRRRVLVVGWLRGLFAKYQFPEPIFTQLDYRTTRSAIEDLPELSPGVNNSDPLHFLTRLSPLNQKRIELIPPGGGFQDLPLDLRAKCHAPGAERVGHRGVYGRLHPDEPSGTITARFDSFTRGRFGHPWIPRNLTLREGARLQTFPDEFQFVGSQEEIAAQIGNAVPPLLAHRIGSSILSHLESLGKVPAEKLFFSKT